MKSRAAVHSFMAELLDLMDQHGFGLMPLHEQAFPDNAVILVYDREYPPVELFASIGIREGEPIPENVFDLETAFVRGRNLNAEHIFDNVTKGDQSEVPEPGNSERKPLLRTRSKRNLRPKHG